MNGGPGLDEGPGSDVNPAPPWMTGLKIMAIYFSFGVAHEALMTAYCYYRVARGNPPDLPCVSLLWTSIGLVGSLLVWPLMVLGDVLNGQAVLVPSLLVRGIGVFFLGGFAAALAWVLRNPRRPPPQSRT